MPTPFVGQFVNAAINVTLELNTCSLKQSTALHLSQSLFLRLEKK